MEAELAALASSGAATLVALMATDAWTQVRDRVARFLARGGDPEGPAAELARTRQDLADDPDGGPDVEAAWRARLRRVLRTDPAAVAELRALLGELDPLVASPGGTVHNSVSGGTQHTVVQGRDLSHFTIGGGYPPDASG